MQLTQVTCIKPGSHMLPMYLRHSHRYSLGHVLDESEHAPPATGAIAELYRRRACEVELESTLQACQGVKTGMSNVASHFCSHV